MKKHIFNKKSIGNYYRLFFSNIYGWWVAPKLKKSSFALILPAGDLEHSFSGAVGGHLRNATYLQHKRQTWIDDLTTIIFWGKQ